MTSCLAQSNHEIDRQAMICVFHSPLFYCREIVVWFMHLAGNTAKSGYGAVERSSGATISELVKFSPTEKCVALTQRTQVSYV